MISGEVTKGVMESLYYDINRLSIFDHACLFKNRGIWKLVHFNKWGAQPQKCWMGAGWTLHSKTSAVRGESKSEGAGRKSAANISNTLESEIWNTLTTVQDIQNEIQKGRNEEIQGWRLP